MFPFHLFSLKQNQSSGMFILQEVSNQESAITNQLSAISTAELARLQLAELKPPPVDKSDIYRGICKLCECLSDSQSFVLFN